MSDFLEDKRREINGRMQELKPLIDEYNRLEAAAAALASAVGTGARRAVGRGRRPGRPRGSTAQRKPQAATRRRRRRGGTRADQALKLVQGQPGITIPELAKKMGIKQNYLYRVLPRLEADGLVRKQGRGWQPKKKG